MMSGIRAAGQSASGNGGNGSAGPSGSAKKPTPEGPGSPFSHTAPQGHAKTTSAVLGEIVWLMSQSPLHKQFFISDLEWFVMTPVLLQQFRLYYDQQKPIGVVLWARVSGEVEARLAEGADKLRPQDWKSGDKLWVVEVIAPFGGAEEMVKDLKAKVFPNDPIKFVATGAAGKEVRTI
ncbi:MAG: toxin-activating lysine-acyltransferase [Hyphomicrobiaceae bacterium]